YERALARRCHFGTPVARLVQTRKVDSGVVYIDPGIRADLRPVDHEVHRNETSVCQCVGSIQHRTISRRSHDSCQLGHWDGRDELIRTNCLFVSPITDGHAGYGRAVMLYSDDPPTPMHLSAGLFDFFEHAFGDAPEALPRVHEAV